MYLIPPEMDPNFFVQQGFGFFTMPWGPWAKAGIQNGPGRDQALTTVDADGPPNGQIAPRAPLIRCAVAVPGRPSVEAITHDCHIAQPTGAALNDIGVNDRQGNRRSDHSNTATASELQVRPVGNSGNLNILSEARIHAPELISDQVSVDPIEEVLCPSLVSREVRR